jgi:uridine phosphorylase
MSCDLPLLEFDAESPPLINPGGVRVDGQVPDRAVVCFFKEVVDEVCGEGRAEIVTSFQWEHGTHVLYRMVVGEQHVAVFHPGVGAPLAAGLLEDVIAVGCSKFVACGGAGAVVPGLALGHVVVPSAAVRDEGTSYHYLPASREVQADPGTVAILASVLEEWNVPHVIGKTWTTDAPYRETRAKIEARRSEGCVTVEMETAAFLAVAEYRGVAFGQFLYAGDDVSGETWDHRRWNTAAARADLFWLAVQAVLRL